MEHYHLYIFTFQVDVPISEAVNIPSHLGCDGDKSDLHPLTFQPLLLDQKDDKSFEIDQSTEFLHYITIKGTDTNIHSSCLVNGDNLAVKETRQSDWSYPVRLMANENGCRMSSAVTVCRDGRSQCVALCLVGQSYQGCVYFTVHVDQTPACYLQITTSCSE